MSGTEDDVTTDSLTAEIRDGQLQIVEVTPYKDEDEEYQEEDEETKYVQVVNPSGKPLMHLDLLNLTLVRCEDGETTYKLVANTEAGSSADEFISPDQVTCVLQTNDGDEQDPDSYVMVEGGELEHAANDSEYVMVEGEHIEEEADSYVMVEGDQGPIVFLQSELKLANTAPREVRKVEKKTSPHTPTPLELLEKAKAVQKAKALLSESLRTRKSRKRSIPMPDAQELLQSPDFKLYLYSCRLCTFKCNAVKEMTEHKAQVHNPKSSKYNNKLNKDMKIQRAEDKIKVGRTLQCNRCPYRSTELSTLLKHVQENHFIETTVQPLNDEGAEILMCHVCGIELLNKDAFLSHIKNCTI